MVSGCRWISLLSRRDHWERKVQWQKGECTSSFSDYSAVDDDMTPNKTTRASIRPRINLWKNKQKNKQTKNEQTSKCGDDRKFVLSTSSLLQLNCAINWMQNVREWNRVKRDLNKTNFNSCDDDVVDDVDEREKEEKKNMLRIRSNGDHETPVNFRICLTFHNIETSSVICSTLLDNNRQSACYFCCNW